MKVKIERRKFTSIGGDTVFLTIGELNEETELYDFWIADQFTIHVPSNEDWYDLIHKYVIPVIKERKSGPTVVDINA